MVGRDPHVQPLPPPLPDISVREALERSVRQALTSGPCFVSFSGGRDSSIVLAVATDVARRDGLPPPVPLTLRFHGPESDEGRWQEQVVRHLGVGDWERIALDDIDFVGPVAADILRRHGVLWPPNAHFHEPILARAAGGSLLTGIDGDVLFGGWQWVPLQPGHGTAVRVMASCWGRYGRQAAFGVLPDAARSIASRMVFSCPPWANPAGWPEIARHRASAWELEPRHWGERVGWWQARRYLACGRWSLSQLAADHDVRLVHPFLDPTFLAALAAAGGRRGFGDRTAAVHRLFGDLLPAAVLARSDKATFDTAMWGEHSRAFIQHWNGGGVDEQLIDVPSLRREWEDPLPHFHTAMLLQTAWLAEDGRMQGSAARPAPSTPDSLEVVRSLLLDRAAAEAVRHLRDHGIVSILLKGPTIATWLYAEGDVRPYDDIDLLVPPAEFEAAKEVLRELGYSHRLDGADPAEFGTLEEELIGPRGACIDLHRGLLGTAASPERCWTTLAGHTIPFPLSVSERVDVLDIPARAMHLCLHAAQGGVGDAKAVADLERGLARLGRDEWRQAARIAEELEATPAFAAGLRLTASGSRLADDLGLTRAMTPELALRVTAARRHALFFVRLSNAPGLRRKVELVARKVFPTTVLLRANSRLANSGPAGLALARAAHPFAVAARAGPALVAWLRARRTAVSDPRSDGGRRPRLGR